MITTLYLARHAEQESTPDEDPAVGISGLGRDQARRLGERLRTFGLDGIHHGPAVRARETAQVMAAELSRVPVVGSGLLQDRTPVPEPEHQHEYSDAERAWLADVPPAERDPGGRQISSAIEHFAALGGRHALVTHAFVVGWFVRSALDSPTKSWMTLNPSNAGLTIIRYDSERPTRPVSLISYNDVGHLPPGV